MIAQPNPLHATLIGVLSAAFIPPAQAQLPVPDTRLEIPSSFNPVGSGARALGMGGAFIPVADDATAASWNPGGLVQLEKPEFSVVGDSLWRTEDNTFSLAPEGSNEGDIDSTGLNYLSASYPFTAFGRNMIVSLNYQKLFEFGRAWDFSLSSAVGPVVAEDQHHYRQDGDLYALGLAYAVQLTPTLSLGVTLNRWDDFLKDSGWTQQYRLQGSGTLAGEPYLLQRGKSEVYDFSGTNVNLGLLWQLTPKLTLGAVIKTPFDADIHHTTTESASLSFPESQDQSIEGPMITAVDETLKMPLSYGLGLAYRHSDRLTLAADLYRTEWSRFALVGADGVERSPLSGRSLSEVGEIEDTLWVRAGMEYLIITDEYVIPLRTGLFYDPAPAEGGSDEFYGFTLGSGIGWRQFIFDIAYQYRTGHNVGEDALPQVGLSQDVTEHRLYGSLIVHF